MACERPLMEQEDWFVRWLEAAPELSYAAGELTLSGDGVTVRFAPARAPVAQAPIAGTDWTLVTIGERGGTASSVPSSVPAPTLRIGDGGKVALFTGCNRGHGTATVRDDGFVDFGPIATTRRACGQPADRVEHQVLAVLDGKVAAAFDGDHQLVLSKDGNSLTFRAR